jgi:energy-coupling factor transporter ATP-binding protein EcfA2
MKIEIKRGKISRSQKVVLYGPEGVGKSTLASQMPSPVFLDTEGSTAQLDVARVEVRDWQTLLAAVAEIHRMPEFQTLVLDTADWAERLAVNAVLQNGSKKSIEDFGYGKGWVMVSEEFNRLLTALDGGVRGGKHVVLLAHSKVVRFAAPDLAGEHDRYELKMSKQTTPLVKEWADAILFANFVTKVVEQGGKGRGVGGKERRLHTSHTAAYDAKNRHGLPETLPCEIASLVPIFKSQESNQAPEEIDLSEEETAFLYSIGGFDDRENLKPDFAARINANRQGFAAKAVAWYETQKGEAK